MALEGSLSPRERDVARYLARRPELAATASASELGKRTGTSNATVVRAVQALGYDGLSDLRDQLLKVMVDRLDPTVVLQRQLERLEPGGIADQVFDSTVQTLQQMRRILDSQAWTSAVELVDKADRVVCYGIEEAGSVADAAAFGLRQCGKPSRSLNTTGLSLANGLLDLNDGDVVVLVALLRRFREIDTIIDHASDVGARTILISESLGVALEGRVNVVLATPQTTHSFASSLAAPMALVHSLTLEVALRNRQRALDARELTNKLRSAAVGADLDVDPPFITTLPDGAHGP
jgi:DNA-binding MurR/RpiR family transcriptional regulator